VDESITLNPPTCPYLAPDAIPSNPVVKPEFFRLDPSSITHYDPDTGITTQNVDEVKIQTCYGAGCDEL
jgi:hypothetical protein